MRLGVDYNLLIPNNVGLADDPRLRKALEKWHPGYIDWWRQMGPDEFQDADVYLRTAISVDPDGWAKFGFVKMPEYRWGILLAPPEQNRRIGFGDHKDEPVWNEVPGEHRAQLRRLIVIQGDTEPASVEQQRLLGKSAPSLYDLRNLFQVNVEEGRHLWAMIYLLQKYFGRDGREEAEELLRRRSGDEDKPRILGAFNENTPDWLSFFMFTFFTDRVGKMQLESFAQSGFDPLARTCRFMLTEEAHHMFVGEMGIRRIVKRTSEAMKSVGIDDPFNFEKIRNLRVIDLPTMQRKLNFHFSITIDLFGSEISTNAANTYSASLKGRFHETKIDDDHTLANDIYPVMKHIGDEFKTIDEPALLSLNSRLCDDYVRECENGVRRWNKIIQAHDIDFTFTLPHRAFNRNVGEFASLHVDPEGNRVEKRRWEVQKPQWLPSANDMEFLVSLMKAEQKPGKFADWIAPPKAGIDNKPGDFEYVRLAH